MANGTTMEVWNGYVGERRTFSTWQSLGTEEKLMSLGQRIANTLLRTVQFTSELNVLFYIWITATKSCTLSPSPLLLPFFPWPNFMEKSTVSGLTSGDGVVIS